MLLALQPSSRLTRRNKHRNLAAIVGTLFADALSTLCMARSAGKTKKETSAIRRQRKEQNRSAHQAAVYIWAGFVTLLVCILLGVFFIASRQKPTPGGDLSQQPAPEKLLEDLLHQYNQAKQKVQHPKAESLVEQVLSQAAQHAQQHGPV